MQKSKFRGAVVGTSVGLIAFGSVASAAFLASGELNAPVRTGTVQAMEVSVDVPAELFPGYLEDASITFTNSNSVATRVVAVEFDRWVTDAPGLATHLVAAKTIAPAGLNGTAVRPLVLEAGQSRTVTIPNLVGLSSAAPNTSTQATGLQSFQGVDATAIYKVSYVAHNGTEVPATVAVAVP